MSGGVAVVTGSSRGIGAGVARRLAEEGFDLLLTARESRAAGRAVDRARAAARPGSRVEWVAADLSRPGEIGRLAATARERFGPPTVLVHCAAVVPERESTTPEGVETQWAVNHLAPFLLTHLLQPEPGPDGRPGRVVTVASQLHRGGRLARSPALFSEGPYHRQQRYRDTKLANVLFARALARRTDADRCVSLTLHPGAAATGLLSDLQGEGTLERWRDRAVRRVKGVEPWGLAECVSRVADLCTRPVDAPDNGSYWENGGIVAPSDDALDDSLGEWLWERSAHAVGT